MKSAVAERLLNLYSPQKNKKLKQLRVGAKSGRFMSASEMKSVKVFVAKKFSKDIKLGFKKFLKISKSLRSFIPWKKLLMNVFFLLNWNKKNFLFCYQRKFQEQKKTEKGFHKLLFLVSSTSFSCYTAFSFFIWNILLCFCAFLHLN